MVGVVKIDGVPISYISPQTVIDYYRDGGVRYPENTVKEGLESLPWTSEMQRVAFALLYATAARNTELISLRVKDIIVDEDAGIITTYLITRKNPRHPVREIPILREVEPFYYDLIYDYYQRVARSKTRKYLFEMGSGKPSPDWLQKLVKRKWYRILSPELRKPYLARPHLFRHTRLTHLVKFFRFDVFKLQYFAGWSDPRPAMYYVHMFSEDIVDQFMERGQRLAKHINYKPAGV